MARPEHQPEPHGGPPGPTCVHACSSAFRGACAACTVKQAWGYGHSMADSLDIHAASRIGPYQRVPCYCIYVSTQQTGQQSVSLSTLDNPARVSEASFATASRPGPSPDMRAVTSSPIALAARSVFAVAGSIRPPLWSTSTSVPSWRERNSTSIRIRGNRLCCQDARAPGASTWQQYGERRGENEVAFQDSEG